MQKTSLASRILGPMIAAFGGIPVGVMPGFDANKALPGRPASRMQLRNINKRQVLVDPKWSRGKKYPFSSARQDAKAEKFFMTRRGTMEQLSGAEIREDEARGIRRNAFLANAEAA